MNSSSIKLNDCNKAKAKIVKNFAERHGIQYTRKRNTCTKLKELGLAINKKPNCAQRGKDEKKNVGKIVNLLKSGKRSKLMIQFEEKFDKRITDATHKGCGGRGKHYDFMIKVNNVWKTVEHKGSKKTTQLNNKVRPWKNSVQMLQKSNEFSILKKYARMFYTIALPTLINKLNIKASKPSLDKWMKGVLAQSGKQQGEFVTEIYNKYDQHKSQLNNLKKEFTKIFQSSINNEDKKLLLTEANKHLKNAFDAKNYWLQVHGVDDMNHRQFRWFNKITHEPFTAIAVKNPPDADVKLVLYRRENSPPMEAKIRWGGRQCVRNLRIDFT